MISRRVAMTAAMLLLAAGLPLGAWYVAGSGDVEHLASRYRLEARHDAEVRATAVARTISQRLEVLRRMEARRSVAAWPARAGDEPLIARYFDTTSGPYAALLDNQVRALRVVLMRAPKVKVVRVAVAPKPVAPPPPRMLVESNVSALNLEPAGIALNIRSQAVALNVEEAVAPVVARRPEGETPSSQPARTPALPALGELVWRSVPGDGGTIALVAVRPIVTLSSVRVQGFEVAPAALAALVQPMGGASLHSSNIATRPTTSAIAVVPGTNWLVSIDEEPSLARAADRANHAQIDFVRTFAAGVFAALLTCIAIIVVVAQSERIALERSRFAAAAAHELRTPLAALRLYGEMLAENLGDPRKAAEYARQISAEAERLGRVVTNVLDFTRIEKGAFGIAPQRDDLGAAVEACVATLQPAIHSAGCELRVRVEPALPSVDVDREALFHIAQNLLDNAEKYSRTSDDRTIEVDVARSKDGVALSVADRGPGVGEELVRAGFVPFRRGKAKSHAPAGLGLGLSLVNALSRAHGGRLDCRPRDGGGTVFTVVFPAA